MGNAIGQMLAFAVGVAVSPFAIVAAVLILITPRAKSNGLTFLLGWMLGIAVLGAIALAVIGPSNPTSQGAPATWVDWLKLVLGVLLLVVGIKEWRSRPAPDAEVPMPKWMGALDGITPVRASGLGVLIGAVNPKNFLFIIGGAAAVAQTGVSGADQTVAWVVFTVIASLGVIVPVGIYFAMGERADEALQRLKGSMVRNNTAIMAVLCLIIAAKLIGDAISGFSS